MLHKSRFVLHLSLTAFTLASSLSALAAPPQSYVKSKTTTKSHSGQVGPATYQGTQSKTVTHGQVVQQKPSPSQARPAKPAPKSPSQAKAPAPQPYTPKPVAKRHSWKYNNAHVSATQQGNAVTLSGSEVHSQGNVKYGKNGDKRGNSSLDAKSGSVRLEDRGDRIQGNASGMKVDRKTQYHGNVTRFQEKREVASERASVKKEDAQRAAEMAKEKAMANQEMIQMASEKANERARK